MSGRIEAGPNNPQHPVRQSRRPWRLLLTAKGYRALGWRLPDSIPDDAVVEPVEEPA